MRRTSIRLALFFLCIFLEFSCTEKEFQPNYLNNSKPLLATQFMKLPLGNVKPDGWLKDQLIAQANGLTGNLDDFWPDLIHSAWKGGGGESWERGPYFLDGLVPLAFLLENSKLIEKSRIWLEWILNSSIPNGWFGPSKNKDRWPLAVAMKAVQQFYESTRDKRALDLLINYFQYLHDNPPDWPDDTWRGVRAMEHAVTGYWLYRRTNDPQILETVQSIFENCFDWTNYFFEFPWDSTAVYENKIPHNWKAAGLTAHVVNVAMAVKYPGLWYQQSGDERYKQAVYTALNNLDIHHGQAVGRFSGDEHLSGKSPSQGTEMCAVVEFMFSMESLFEIFGDPIFADRLELLAYNALPGTMTPDCWAHQYDQQSNQVLVSDEKRGWSTNGDASNIYGLMPNYPCCLANMHQGWPKFVQHMWMATNDGGLIAVCYGPNRVSAKVADNYSVEIIQKTEYPFDDTIQFEIFLKEATTFPLYFRIPTWASEASLKINDENVLYIPQNKNHRMERKWKTGDVVTLRLPMRIRSEQRFNHSVSILRGPLYYSLRIGKDYGRIRLKSENITSIEYKGSTDWQINPTTPWNYGLFLKENNIDNDFSIKRNQITKYPFSDIGEMVYSELDRKYVSWNFAAPVELLVHGKRIADWGMKNNSADVPPTSPINSDYNIEALTLIPYGCTRLRITEFPVVK